MKLGSVGGFRIRYGSTVNSHGFYVTSLTRLHIHRAVTAPTLKPDASEMNFIVPLAHQSISKLDHDHRLTGSKRESTMNSFGKTVFKVDLCSSVRFGREKRFHIIYMYEGQLH